MGKKVTNIATDNAVVGAQIGDVDDDLDIEGGVINIASGNATVGVQIGRASSVDRRNR